MRQHLTKLRTPRRLCNASRASVLALLLVLTSACVVEDNDSSLGLGSVSIGDQLIDLQKARDANAINEDEYQSAKTALLERLATDQDSDDDTRIEIRVEADNEDKDDDENDDEDSEEEQDSGFIF